jgi:hypothetical protein
MLRRQPSVLQWASFNTHPLCIETCDNVPAPPLEGLPKEIQSNCLSGLRFVLFCKLSTGARPDSAACGPWGGGVFRVCGRVNSKRERDCEVCERGQRGLGSINVLANMT